MKTASKKREEARRKAAYDMYDNYAEGARALGMPLTTFYYWCLRRGLKAKVGRGRPTVMPKGGR